MERIIHNTYNICRISDYFTTVIIAYYAYENQLRMKEGWRMIKYLVKKYLRRKYKKLNEKCNELEEKLAYTGTIIEYK